MSLENIRTQLGLEIESIDRLLFESYTELFAQVQGKEPNLIEMTTLACVLHSFYNGVENICLSIAQVLDKEVPARADWHRKLLGGVINLLIFFKTVCKHQLKAMSRKKVWSKNRFTVQMA